MQKQIRSRCRRSEESRDWHLPYVYICLHICACSVIWLCSETRCLSGKMTAWIDWWLLMDTSSLGQLVVVVVVMSIKDNESHFYQNTLKSQFNWLFSRTRHDLNAYIYICPFFHLCAYAGWCWAVWTGSSSYEESTSWRGEMVWCRLMKNWIHDAEGLKTTFTGYGSLPHTNVYMESRAMEVRNKVS